MMDFRHTPICKTDAADTLAILNRIGPLFD